MQCVGAVREGITTPPLRMHKPITAGRRGRRPLRPSLEVQILAAGVTTDAILVQKRACGERFAAAWATPDAQIQPYSECRDCRAENTGEYRPRHRFSRLGKGGAADANRGADDAQRRGETAHIAERYQLPPCSAVVGGGTRGSRGETLSPALCVSVAIGIWIAGQARNCGLSVRVAAPTRRVASAVHAITR